MVSSPAYAAFLNRARVERLDSQEPLVQQSPSTSSAPIDDLLRRIQGEYLEMPGLRLTVAQAQRMWQLSSTECEALLAALVDSGFLIQMPGGAFIRTGSDSAQR